MFVLSLSCIAAGVAAATVSLRVPDRRAVLEGAGGGLLVLGLVAIGIDLPLFR